MFLKKRDSEIFLTLRARVPSSSKVAVAARTAAFVISETEAVGRTHSIITAQVVHTRYLAFPGGRGRSRSGGRQRDALEDKKRKKDKEL